MLIDHTARFWGEVLACDALDQAYPPRLAQSWDAVGLVCGDPDDSVNDVVVAVDATPAEADQQTED